MLRRAIFYLIFFQVVTVALIVGNIYHKKKVLGITTVSTLDKTEILNSSDSGYRFFYEPAPGISYKDSNPRFDASYSINKDSLHDREYSVSKDKRTYRIVTLGDSFTFGLHVSTDKNWTNILEEELQKICKSSKWEVINLGVSGYDRKYAVERYKKRGEKYDPDMVIWFDVSPYRDTEAIREKISHLPTNMSSYERFNVKFREFEREIRDSKTERENEDILTKDVLSLREFFKGKLLLLAMPFISLKERETLQKIAKNNYDVYYFGNLVNIYKEGLQFENDGHPNEEGHKRIAADVLKYIKDSNLIPCD